MNNYAIKPGAENEFYFQWHITEKCNFRCKHCYHADYTSANELSLNELILIADKIDATLRKWNKDGTLSITGGEPFMVMDKLFPLLKHINSLETIIHFDLLTNGSLLDEATISELKEFRKLRRVQVSLEAGNQKLNDRIRGKGSFEKTLSAIRLLKENGFHVAVMMTISHMNKNEVEPLIELLKKNSVDTFSAERFIPEGVGAGLKDEFLTAGEVREVFQKIYSIAMKEDKIRLLLYRPLFALLDGNDPTVGALCSVGNNALTIMHDGTIYPCRRLPIPIGNSMTDSFYKVWYTSEILWNVRNQKKIKGKCADCDLIPVCRGCRAIAYALTGDYLAEDPQCWK
ncbi:MAG: radical SAM protein [Deltaproteobacteria bacterium]|nr:radical SAM protein [Deltaproteobacteria bacterium]MBW2150109.1 radical SAM protein [Deltaproteobacteria bacterium]